MHLNTWTGIGTVVADPQLRVANSGKKWTKFTIVCKEYFGGQEIATFVDIVAWDKRAETICRHVKKGYQLTVKGPLRIKPYSDEKHGGLRRKSVQVEGYYFSWDAPRSKEKAKPEDAVIQGLEFMFAEDESK